MCRTVGRGPPYFCFKCQKPKQVNGETVTFHLDSELVVKQVRGEYKIKNEKLRQLFQTVKEGEKNFKTMTYVWLPRSHEFMKKADRLVNEALDGE